MVDPQPVRTAAGYKATSSGPLLEGGGEKEGLAPKELREAYKIPATGGGTETIAIVDAYDDPTAQADLNVYRKKYGLSECTTTNGCFKKVNQTGEEKNYPSSLYPHIPLSNIVEDWGLEISLDLDMVSAACAECKILLVEASNKENSNLYAAENEAVTLEKGGKKIATEVSNSWGGPEYPEETSQDTHFNHTDIPTTASAGDSGYGVEYPAASKNVISVGGTTLKKKAGGERGWEDTTWAGTGSGCSAYESKPAWQGDPSCVKRTNNDVAAVANNKESPVSVYDSYEYKEESGYETGKLGWVLAGGTSVAAPLIAGIEAHASSTVKDEAAEAFYRHALFDVTSGLDGACGHTYLCEAVAGYDGPTGWGTPDGPLELAAGFHVITDAAINVTATGAKLTGYVNPGGLETTYHFEYGPTTSYGTNVPVPSASVGSGALWTGVSQNITGLHTLQGTYHYRLVATNSSKTIDGEDHTFTTVPWTVQATPNPSGSGESRLEGVSCSSSTACTAVSSYNAASENTRWALVEGWNGTEWKIQTTPKPTGATYAWLYGASCVSSTACTAVGFYGNASDTFFPLAERWNGTEWAIQTTPSKSGGATSEGESELVGVSCSSSTACTAVGYYCEPEGKECVSRNNGGSAMPLAERWNGTEWSVQAIPSPTGAKSSNLRSVSCASSTECVAVGVYTNSSGVVVPLAERWSGTEWSVQATPSPTGAKSSDVVSVSCASSHPCTAVGVYTNSSNVVVPLVERWNGTEWSIQTTPTPPGGKGELSGVSCASSTECTAVGGRLSEHWNGTEWTIEPIAMPEEAVGFENTALSGVSCLASTACVAVGTHVGSTEGGLGEFATLAEGRASIKPYVETGQATSIGTTGATLNGVVNPEGVESKYFFEYGTTLSYGSKTTEVTVGAGTSSLEESKAITSLASGTTYHFRIVAASSNGTTAGSDHTFTTTAKPSVETKAATNVRATSATLNGTVNPNGAETTYYFEYGKTIAYGTSVPVPSANVGSGTSSLEESKVISGLELNTVYHFRIVATNSAGTTDGADKTFTTLTAPSWRVTTTANPTGGKTSRLEGTSCTSPSACVAVGNYENSAGATLALAQVWNGEEWNELTPAKPTGATETELSGVSCTSLSACTAVGSFLNSSGVAVVLAERWNGATWAVQEPPNPTGAKGGGLSNVSCTSSSACTAVGAYVNSAGAYTPLAENWNGTSWAIKETPNPSGAKQGQLLGVSCTSASACTAVGEYENSPGTLWLAQAEVWNGETWSLQEPPRPAGATITWPYEVSCTSSSACTAVGYYDSATEGELSLAESWNGKSWSVQPTPNPVGSGLSKLVGVTCTSSTACTAVGYYWTGEPVEELTLAEHWNGTEWTILSTPNPSGAPDSRLLGISCSTSTVCTGVGYYVKSKTEGNIVTLAEIYG